MAILQVRDIDDKLYSALKKKAKLERRSISKEVIKILEDYLAQSELSENRATEEFLNLVWVAEEESMEDVVNKIKSGRTESDRFSEMNDVFD